MPVTVSLFMARLRSKRGGECVLSELAPSRPADQGSVAGFTHTPFENLRFAFGSSLSKLRRIYDLLSCLY